jgi:hypothetical protein
VPIILASDKTKLGNFCGNKQAWPVYMTIGNICKDVRKKVSSGASLLIGYLPVTKLGCFKKASRSKAQADLFHFCMRLLVEPLRKAGSEGIPIGCSDGFTRWCHLVLAAYVADNPEQCLIAGVKQNRCHVGTVPIEKRGDFAHCPRRDPQRTLNDLKARLFGSTTSTLVEHGLNDIDSPFWADLPFCNIFQCLTPDLLHQFHRGVFADHILEWAMTIIGKAEFDRRYTVMPSHDGVRHFDSGISELSQTNGTEQKEIEKEFVAAVHGSDEDVVKAAVAALDFITLSSLPSHTEASIAAVAEAISRLHDHKQIFIDLGGRLLDHFNLNKLHPLLHYPEFILSHGSLDGYNTEWSERLHIDLAKNGYRATNHISYTAQMAAWLARREKVAFFDAYLDWVRNRMPSAFVARDSERSRKAAALQTTESNSTVFQFATRASWPKCSVQTLRDMFGCYELTTAMSQYLDTRDPNGSHIVTDADTYEVFTRVNLKPWPGHTAFGVSAPEECIRAGPSPGSAARSASFDTVLVHRQCSSDGARPNDSPSRMCNQSRSVRVLTLVQSLSGCTNSCFLLSSSSPPRSSSRTVCLCRMVH